jgi:hypothetical protein
MVYRMKHVKGTGQICGRCGEEVRRVWWTSKQGAGRRVGMTAPRHECGCLPGTKSGPG